ncbi:hypothetical protein ACWCQW_41380 [Streptomyces mirabilis]
MLRVAARDRGGLTVDEAGGEPLGDTTRLRLGLDLDGSALRLRYDTGPGWRSLGPTLDATVLSDEHAEEMEGDRIRALGFTGLRRTLGLGPDRGRAARPVVRIRTGPPGGG